MSEPDVTPKAKAAAPAAPPLATPTAPPNAEQTADDPVVSGRATLGSKGPHVVAIQRKLGLEETGKFGHAERDAVLAKQNEAGVAPNGVVDQETWTLL